MSVPKMAVQITCTQYIKDFSRYDCARNMSEEYSTARQSSSFTEILPVHVLPHSPQE